MKPALTKEEWERYLGDAVDSSGHTIDNKTMARHIEISAHYQEFHRAAAICLHNQPFGFTREDVTLLRIMHQSLEHHGIPQPRVFDLIDRIEALLPPEE